MSCFIPLYHDKLILTLFLVAYHLYIGKDKAISRKELQMYRSLGALNGMVIAIMIYSNSLMMTAIGNTPSLMLNHMIGFITILTVILLTKEEWKSIKGINLIYLAGGVTGLISVYFTNIAFVTLGATLTLMLSMIGRIVTSSVIDHFGLMGMKKYPFRPIKLIGIFFMAIGLVFIIMG